MPEYVNNNLFVLVNCLCHSHNESWKRNCSKVQVNLFTMLIFRWFEGEASQKTSAGKP